MFRLIELSINKPPVLRNVHLVFCNDAMDIDTSVYTTGIIGPNGIGKSHLLSGIADVFIYLYDVKRNDFVFSPGFTFTVTYVLNGNRYTISNSTDYKIKVVSSNHFKNPGSLYVTRNEMLVDISSIELPIRVIASTMTVTDKFLAKSSPEPEFYYRYRGIRNENSPSTTGTRTIIRKTVASIMDCMSSKSEFQEELRLLLDKLDLEEHLKVTYGMRYKNIFMHPNMTPDKFRQIFDNWQDYFKNRRTPPWGFNYYKKIRNDEVVLERICGFLSKKATYKRGRNSVSLDYDVMSDPYTFQQEAEAIRLLSQLDLLSFPSIHVVKKGVSYRFEDSSSGETHLLCQFIGIMADIRHGSLIIIDEPENSCHPDWQMNYVGWLKSIFSLYSDCHFVIATHSPHILANMKASSSTIVRLKRRNGQIFDDGGMEEGCYSWSVDEILQDVMEMKSIHTDEFNTAMKDFEKALDDDNREKANIAYEKLIPLIRPGNVLMELLRIQMIGLSTNKGIAGND